jgi:hypothetical protein
VASGFSRKMMVSRVASGFSRKDPSRRATIMHA